MIGRSWIAIAYDYPVFAVTSNEAVEKVFLRIFERRKSLIFLA
jgi:hypothetical protein